MRNHVAIAWLVAAIPAAAVAAEQPGIDLSQPPRPDAPQGRTDRPGGDEPAKGEELPPIDLSRPGEPSPPAPAPAPEKPRAFQPFSEKDVALGDKVKAVQRKGFLKKGRFEVAPLFATTVNDAFYQKFGYGLRLAYNLHDSFAVALRGARYTKYRTDNVREGKLAFRSQLLSSDIEQQAMLGGVWSPIYGKASILQSSIVHFDLFLQAGFGLVWTDTSGPPRNEGAFGLKLPWADEKEYPKLATEFGGGVRFYPKEWLAFEVGLLATFYPDQPAEQLPATTQRVFVMNVGMSFFWPTTFEYVYP